VELWVVTNIVKPGRVGRGIVLDKVTGDRAEVDRLPLGLLPGPTGGGSGGNGQQGGGKTGCLHLAAVRGCDKGPLQR
jgi:hypothetical protein